MRTVRILGLAAVLVGIPAGAPTASAVGEELGGWNTTASASAYTVFPAIPSLVPYDAPVEATVALSQATLSTGGSGFGRASTLWPGVLAGLGPLMKQVNPDLPTLPEYPLVVESREHDEPKRTEQAGTVMSAHVTPARAVVDAAATGQGAEGLFTIGASRSQSIATVEAGRVTAESTARVNDIVLAAGAVTIDAVTSRSTATTDGDTGSCDGGALVTGMMIGGIPATVDESGVHAEEQDAPLPADLNGTIAGVLDATGIRLRVVGGIADCDGPTASRSGGGLLISIPLPAGGPVPPGGTLNVVIGSSAVTAEAASMIAFDAPVTPLPVGAPSIAAPIISASPTPIAPSAPGNDTVAFAPIDDERPAPYEFGGVPASVVGGMVLLSVPATKRIRRYAERVIALVRG